MSVPPGPDGPEPDAPEGSPGERPRTRTAFQQTPNAEKYVLEADAMRRRQLRSALLHGSRRTWRENPRVWPAVVIGIILSALIVAGLIVSQALQTTEKNQKKQDQEQQAPPSAPVRTGPVQPSASPGSPGQPGAEPSTSGRDPDPASDPAAGAPSAPASAPLSASPSPVATGAGP